MFCLEMGLALEQQWVLKRIGKLVEETSDVVKERVLTSWQERRFRQARFHAVVVT